MSPSPCSSHLAVPFVSVFFNQIVYNSDCCHVNVTVLGSSQPCQLFCKLLIPFFLIQTCLIKALNCLTKQFRELCTVTSKKVYFIHVICSTPIKKHDTGIFGSICLIIDYIFSFHIWFCSVSVYFVQTLLSYNSN